jgi:hypothetical protein
MAYWNKAWLLAAILLVATFAARPASATEPPADLCSLLPAAEVSKTVGQTYDAPKKSVAPRPFPNTASGTDCIYMRSNDARERKLVLRAYVDPSPAVAADLFTRLGQFYGKPTPVAGLGDEAYFDKSHGLHVRKGKVRFYIAMDDFDEKQVKELASRVAGQL